MASHSDFGEATTSTEAAQAFGKEICGKTGQSGLSYDSDEEHMYNFDLSSFNHRRESKEPGRIHGILN
jgi:hypothetical protein